MQSFAISLPPPSASVTSSQSPIDTASGAQEALKKGLTAAQETITELRAQLEESAQRAALRAESRARSACRAAQKAEHRAVRCRNCKQNLTTLRAQAEEYGRVKAHIADIELSARERADALDAATRAQIAIDASPPARRQCARVLCNARQYLRERFDPRCKPRRCRRVAAARRVHHAGRPARRA